MRKVNWKATARQDGKMMVNEFERDAVSDVVLIVDSRQVSETGPVSRNSLVSVQELQLVYLSTTGGFCWIWCMEMRLFQWTKYWKKQLYILLTKLAGAMARNTP